MEFKGSYSRADFPSSLHINRIKVEFKGTGRGRGRTGTTILIESKWNLKQSENWAKISSSVILIESKWNLKNKIISRFSLDLNNINRIKVEFKVIFLLSNHIICYNINRIKVEFKVICLHKNSHFLKKY